MLKFCKLLHYVAVLGFNTDNNFQGRNSKIPRVKMKLILSLKKSFRRTPFTMSQFLNEIKVK